MLPLLASCDGLLDEINYGNPTTPEMMETEDNITLVVGQAYADLKWIHDHWGYWGVASLTSDECLNPVRMPGSHWKDGGYWKSLNVHTWNAFGEALRNIWNTTISGAVLCNKLIYTLNKYKENMSEALYLQYIAELEVLRSYYYYLLFDCFGRIPYLEDFSTSTEPLMEPQAVWTRLIACLERTAPSLPQITDANRSQYYGRVTQGFAYSLLARLYLNAKSYGCDPALFGTGEGKFALPEGIEIKEENDFYRNAIRCCDMVIGAPSYSIEENYFTNFKIHNENSRENIFVIVEEGSENVDVRYSGSMMNKLRLIPLSLHYQHQQAWNLIQKPWNGFCARPDFIKLYAPTDVRGTGNEGKGTQNTKQWGWFVGPVTDANGKLYLDENDKKPVIITPEVASLDAATWNDGARMIKYEVDKSATYSYCENDFVLFRYADVLWMREEAAIRCGGTRISSSAQFQKMLERSFAYDADPSAAFKAAYGDVETWGIADLEKILDERGREFAWELVRRRDLIRFGKYHDIQYVTIKNQPHRNWFPIPYSVLEKGVEDKNGNKIWTQTEGY